MKSLEMYTVVQKEQHFLIECSQISEEIYNKDKLMFLGLNSMQPLYEFELTLPLLAFTLLPKQMSTKSTLSIFYSSDFYNVIACNCEVIIFTQGS